MLMYWRQVNRVGEAEDDQLQELGLMIRNDCIVSSSEFCVTLANYKLIEIY